MRQKLFSVKNGILTLLTFMLVICLTLGLGFTIPAHADESGNSQPAATFIIGADNDSFEEGWNNAVKYSCDNSALVKVTLASDWTAEDNDDYITSFGSDSGDGFSYGRIYVPKGANIILDLNGYNVDRKICDENGETPETAALDRVAAEDFNEEVSPTRQGSVIHVVGTLEITDSNEAGGKICGGYGSFLINGNNSEYSQRGGGVSVVADAALVLSGNAVISGNIARWGGGVYIDPYAKFTMNGGVIENNYSTQGGGGVLVSGKFIMNDGTISGNTATTTGGGVYVNALPNEEFLREDNSLLCIFEMYGGSIEGNTAKSHGGGVANSYIFEMSGGSIEGNTATTHAGGVYNLAAGTFTMTDGSISGNTAGSNGGGVYNAGTGTMAGGSISGNTATTAHGGGVYNYTNGTFTMTDGSISGNTAGSNGGGVYNNTNGTFEMADGSITENEAKSSGGGVYNNTNGTFKMTGGIIGIISDDDSIKRNTAKNGGGVYNYTNGTFTMTAGTISGNTATTHGGGVYNAGTGTMAGGSISGNTATSNGGGVYNYTNGTFTMTAGSIEGNKASNGGGVYNYTNGTFTMTDGSIEGNEATSNGGGVYNYTDGSFTMKGGIIGTISDDDSIIKNTANNGGGLYNVGTFTMTDGTISGNTAKTHGGGLFNAYEFIMGGGSITGNTAASHGGGVFNGTATVSNVAFIGTFTMKGGSISGNTAGSNGGGVYNNTNCTFTMKGGIIGTISDDDSTRNKAKNGGGVYNNTGSIVNLSGNAVIQNNIISTSTTNNASNLQLQAGHNLTVGELTEGAYIGIKASVNVSLSTSINVASLKYMHNDAVNYYLVINKDGQLSSVAQSNTWSLYINGDEMETDVPEVVYAYGKYGKDNVISITYGGADVTLYKVGDSGETRLTVSSSYELTAGTYYALNSTESERFNFIIKQLELDEEVNLKIDGLPAENDGYKYTGKQQIFVPQITITLESGEQIVPNYLISYTNNLNVGTATLTLNIIGTDNYSEYTITRNFEIVPSDTEYTVVWEYFNGTSWEPIKGNTLTVTFNNSNYFNSIRAVLTPTDGLGSEICIDGSSTGLKLTASGEIVSVNSYTVLIDGSGNYTVPENSKLTVNVEKIDLSGLDENSFTGEDAQTRRLWLLHIGDTTSQLRSSATYYANEQVITGTEEYYYARYREGEELSIALNDAYAVTFKVGNTSYTFTIAQLKALNVKVTYTNNTVTCSSNLKNTLKEVTTEVTLRFDGNFSDKEITITKVWAIVTINNGLLNGNGGEFSISDYTWGGASSITEAPVPEHGDVATFTLRKGDTIITEFTVRYDVDGTQTLTGDDVVDENQTFAEFVNLLINANGSGTYRLAVSIAQTTDGDEVYYQVDRTFQFTVNPYVLTAAEVRLSASSFIYNGGAIEPNIECPAGATFIKEYSNNINFGTATVIVTGIGNYTGSVELKFEIEKATNNQLILAAQGWTYGSYSQEELDSVLYSVHFRATANYGIIEYTVRDSKGNIVPLSELAYASAGTYTVEAVVIGTDDYDAAELQTASFVIAKAGHVWEETPNIMSWVKGEYDKNENGVKFEDIFGNTVTSENVNILIYDANLSDSEINDKNVIYKVVNGEVVINKLANAEVGHYILKVTIDETDDYFGAEKTFSFQIFAPEGLAWWAWLLIIVGILGVVAAVFFILHEKGVLQMLTGKFVIAMRTKMSVDATIAAVRANMVAERSAKTRAEAQKRDRLEELRKAREEAKQRPIDEQAAALDEQAALAAQKAEKMQKRAASMQKRAEKMRAQANEEKSAQEATVTDDTDSTEE